MTLLRRDLMIANSKDNTIYFINLEDIEFGNENKKEIIYRSVNLDQFKNKFDFVDFKHNVNFKCENCVNKIDILKCHSGYNILMRRNDKEILLFTVANVVGKLKGKEEIGFNFKIPIIFVALVIIFLYHYFKNRINPGNPEEYSEEVMRELKKRGAFDKVK
jgi:hypothetical protein